MAASLLVILTILSAAAWPLGWRAGSSNSRRATLAAAAAALSIGGGAWFCTHASWFPEWLIAAPTVMLLRCWFVPLAVFLFAIGAAQARTRNPDANATRRRVRGLAALSALLVVYGCWNLTLSWAWTGWENDVALAYRDAHGRPLPHISDGVVMQTTGYTCSACSAATLLRRTGIDPQATEAQMVPRVHTQRWDGCMTLGLAAGLRAAGREAGWRVAILEPDFETLRRLRKPAVCTVKLNAFINHSVVVCEMDARKGVLIGDPLRGLTWWSEARFRKQYLNDAVLLYKQDPFEPYAPVRAMRTPDEPVVVEW